MTKIQITVICPSQMFDYLPVSLLNLCQFINNILTFEVEETSTSRSQHHQPGSNERQHGAPGLGQTPQLFGDMVAAPSQELHSREDKMSLLSQSSPATIWSSVLLFSWLTWDVMTYGYFHTVYPDAMPQCSQAELQSLLTNMIIIVCLS